MEERADEADVPEPQWSSLKLLEANRNGMLFEGEYAGTWATVVRLVPDAVASLISRVRLQDLIAAPGVRRVLAGDLETAAPWFAVERPRAFLSAPQSLEAALELVAELTRAIAAAHRVGLVHGGLKPSSVGLIDGHAVISFLADDPDAATSTDPRGDLMGLGRVLASCVGALPPDARTGGWLEWANRLMDSDPARRPALADLAQALGVTAEPGANGLAGHFALDGTLLTGPTGVVRRGVDVASGAPVTLTICTVDGASRARAARSCATLASLRHPCLPVIREVAEDAASIFYAAQPTEDRRLAALRGQPLTEAGLAHLGAQLASALALLHAHGLVHGGVSPEWVTLNGATPVLQGVGCFADATDPAADVRSLGQLLRGLLGDKAPSPGLRRLLESAEAGTTAAEPLAEQLFAFAGYPLASAAAHPRAPAASSRLQSYTLECELKASPVELWSWVSNTERVNRASNVSAATRRVERVPGGEPIIHGETSQVGFTLAWVERPFEWVAGQRFGVLREYSQGPLEWLRSVVELHALPGGGTRLVQTLEAQPRSILFAPVVAAEVGLRTRSALRKVYERIDAYASKTPAERLALDPFDDLEGLSGAQEAELSTRSSALLARGVDPAALRALTQALRTLSAQDLARLQPLRLADRFDVDGEAMISACMAAAAEGLLVPFWDVLCPSCRVASDQAESFTGLTALGHCEVCAMEFENDLSESIELVFRPSPKVREADTHSYCLSSPAHAPHVALQQTLGVSERLALSFQLAAGPWHLTRRGAPVISLEVRDDPSLPETAEVSLQHSADWVGLRGGVQRLIITNDTGAPVRVRLESAHRRQTVLSAARALSHPLFSSVFPDARLGAGVQVSASRAPIVAIWADAPERLAALVASAVSAGGLQCRKSPALVIMDSEEHAFAAALTVAQAGGRASLEVCATTLISGAGALECDGADVDRLIAGLELTQVRQVVAGPVLAAHPGVADVVSVASEGGALERVGAAGAWGVLFQIS